MLELGDGGVNRYYIQPEEQASIPVWAIYSAWGLWLTLKTANLHFNLICANDTLISSWFGRAKYRYYSSEWPFFSQDRAVDLSQLFKWPLLRIIMSILSLQTLQWSKEILSSLSNWWGTEEKEIKKIIKKLKRATCLVSQRNAHWLRKGNQVSSSWLAV